MEWRQPAFCNGGQNVASIRTQCGRAGFNIAVWTAQTRHPALVVDESDAMAAAHTVSAGSIREYAAITDYWRALGLEEVWMEPWGLNEQLQLPEKLEAPFSDVPEDVW